MIILSLLLCFLFDNSDPALNKNLIKNNKDTLYYTTFLDLYEKDFRNGSKLKNDIYDLTGEREDMGKQIKRVLRKYFVVLRLPDTCLNKIHIDSVSRKNEKVLTSLCKSCGIKKDLLILDASWIYLSKDAYRTVGRTMDNLLVSGVGTWWIVHLLVYDSFKEEITYKRTNNFNQGGNVKPMKHFPGITHRRFISRSVRRARYFLISQ